MCPRISPLEPMILIVLVTSCVKALKLNVALTDVYKRQKIHFILSPLYQYKQQKGLFVIGPFHSDENLINSNIPFKPHCCLKSIGKLFESIVRHRLFEKDVYKRQYEG